MKRREFVTLVGASCLGFGRRAALGAEPPRSRSIYHDQGEATSLALSADDRVLAVALVSDIGLWDVRGSRHVRWIATHSPAIRQFGKDAYAVRHMAFSP